MNVTVEYDCYNGTHKCGLPDHDPNLITIFHIDYIYLPSDPNNRVEVIIRDHDDTSLPCFHILSDGRGAELYTVSIFDNSYTEGLSKDDKEYLNEFLRSDNTFFSKSKPMNTFILIRNTWELANLDDDDNCMYDDFINPPYYK